MSDTETSYKKFSLKQRRMTLRKFRALADFTLKEVAKMAGMSESMLSRFETGKRDLSPKAFARLEKVIIELTAHIEKRRLEKEARGIRDAAHASTLAGRFVPFLKEHVSGVPLGVLASRTAWEEFRESERQMEAQYGPKWREVFAEIRDLNKEKADLEKRIAELRDLLAIETASALKDSEAKELRERIAKRETIPPQDEDGE